MPVNNLTRRIMSWMIWWVLACPMECSG